MKAWPALLWCLSVVAPDAAGQCTEAPLVYQKTLFFGESLAMDGDTLVAGDSSEFSFVVGVAYVYERDLGGSGAWGEAKALIPSDFQSYSEFGNAVDISGDTIVVGAWQDDGLLLNSGAAYVFERDLGVLGNGARSSSSSRPSPPRPSACRWASRGTRSSSGVPDTLSVSSAAPPT